MPFFDTEITIPVRIHYNAYQGYPQTYWEPGEPASAEIEYVQFQEKLIEKSKSGVNTYIYKHHDLPAEVAEFISDDAEIESDLLDYAADEEQENYITAMEAKADARREDGDR